MFTKFLSARRYQICTLAVFTFLALVSWGKHWNLLVDVGRELETTARIADGQLLYRDIQSYYTPLAYYANAWALATFGKHIAVFYAVSLLLKGVLVVAVYRLTNRLVGESSYAAAICCGMLAYFSFTPGNVNQSGFSMLYALVFSALVLVALQIHLQRPRPWLMVLVGGLAGLCVLAKQEFGVASVGAVLFVLTLRHLDCEAEWSVRLRGLAAESTLFLGSLVVVAGVPLVWFLQQVGWHQLVEQSLFPQARFSVFTSNEAMRASPAKTLFVWGRSLLYFLVSSAVVVGVNSLLRRRLTSSVLLIGIGTTLCFPLLYLLCRVLQVSDLFPFNYLHWSIAPFILAGMLGYRQISRSLGKAKALILVALLAIVVLVNLRWLLAVEIYDNYGVLLFVLFGISLGLLAPRLSTFLGSPVLYLAVCTGVMALLHAWEFSRYDARIESPYGDIYTPARETRYQRHEISVAFNEALAFLGAHVRPQDRDHVLVLPDGSFLNFLSGTHSPARELTYVPGIIAGPQEEAQFIARMRRQTRFILLVDRTYDGWAQKEFRQFNPHIYNWVTSENQLVAQFPKRKKALIQVYESLPSQ